MSVFIFCTISLSCKQNSHITSSIEHTNVKMKRHSWAEASVMWVSVRRGWQYRHTTHFLVGNHGYGVAIIKSVRDITDPATNRCFGCWRPTAGNFLSVCVRQSKVSQVYHSSLLSADEAVVGMRDWSCNGRPIKITNQNHSRSIRDGWQPYARLVLFWHARTFISQ